MENKEMQELLKKMKASKSAEELVEMAKAQGKELPADKAQELFAKLNGGELSEEQLDAVAGGMTYEEWVDWVMEYGWKEQLNYKMAKKSLDALAKLNKIQDIIESHTKFSNY